MTKGCKAPKKRTPVTPSSMAKPVRSSNRIANGSKKTTSPSAGKGKASAVTGRKTQSSTIHESDDEDLDGEDVFSGNEATTLSPTAAAQRALEKQREHDAMIQAQTKAMRDKEDADEGDDEDGDDEDGDDNLDDPAQSSSFHKPLFTSSSLGLRRIVVAPSQTDLEDAPQHPSTLDERASAEPAAEYTADMAAHDADAEEEDSDEGSGRMMKYDVVDATPTTSTGKKRKRKTKKRLASSVIQNSNSDSDSSSVSIVSQPVKKRCRRRKSKKQELLGEEDETSGNKFTGESFHPDLYKTLETLKKVVRRYYLLNDLYCYTEGDKTSVYAYIWKNWAKSDEAPADAMDMFTCVANDRGLMEACCIYINYTRPYFCTIFLNICRGLLAWVGIPGTLEPEDLKELCAWLVDKKLKYPFLHGGLDVRIRTFDKSKPYQAPWIANGIHTFGWNARGRIDRWASRALLAAQEIGLPVFALFTTTMAHCIREYSSGKRPHFIPFDAATNTLMYYDQVTKLKCIRRKSPLYWKVLSRETFDKCCAMSNKGAMVSAPRDSEDEDSDDYDFAMLNRAAEAVALELDD